MIRLGYGQDDTSPKPYFSFSEKTSTKVAFELAPDCQGIASQEQAAQIIHHRRKKFQAEQPQVFHRLFEAVQLSINECATKARIIS